MTVKQDLKALQKEFKALGKKVEKLTKGVERSVPSCTFFNMRASVSIKR